MAVRRYSNTATEATLTSGITASDVTVAVTSFAGFPAPPFTAVIDRGTASEEIILVTAVAGSGTTSVTATRGYDGTTSKSHDAGAPLLHVTVAKDYDEANAHVNATSGVHGLSGAPVGTTDAQTLTNKTLTSPTVSSPTVTGTATAASMTLSGSLSVTGTSTLGAASATSLSLSGALTVGGASTFTGAVTVPVATLAAHPVRKEALDAVNTALDARLDTAEATLAAATASSTANAIMRRSASAKVDAAGFQFSGPQPGDVFSATRKDYVDAINTALDARLDVLEADTDWVTPTLSSGWTNYGTGYVPTRHRKIRGKVEVQIMAGGGAVGLLFTLPVGSRPSATLPPIPAISNVLNLARVEVTSAGGVSIVSLGTGNNAYVGALFSFHADA